AGTASLLLERRHLGLLLTVLGLAAVAARGRLDGAARHHDPADDGGTRGRARPRVRRARGRSPARAYLAGLGCPSALDPDGVHEQFWWPTTPVLVRGPPRPRPTNTGESTSPGNATGATCLRRSCSRRAGGSTLATHHVEGLLHRVARCPRPAVRPDSRDRHSPSG